MHQIVYSSAAVAPFSDAQLSELLAIARSNNGQLGVTGMLLYHEGSFLQVLEGEPHALAGLYAKIARDQRHHRVVALLDRDVEERHFGQWQMGFVPMSSLPNNLPGFSDFLRLRGEPLESTSAATRLLASFREGRLRSFIRT